MSKIIAGSGGGTFIVAYGEEILGDIQRIFPDWEALNNFAASDNIYAWHLLVWAKDGCPSNNPVSAHSGLDRQQTHELRLSVRRNKRAVTRLTKQCAQAFAIAREYALG